MTPSSSDSRSCRGCPSDRPRTAPGSARPRPQRPCWPPPADTPPRPSAWESRTACHQALASSFRFLPGPLRPRLTESTFLVSRPLGSTATPAGSTFSATTGRSAGARRIGTQCLRFPPRHAPSRDPDTRSRSPYRRSPSHVPCKSRRPGSRRLYAGHHLARITGTRQARLEAPAESPDFDAT
jgi:hypothetical protein